MNEAKKMMKTALILCYISLALVVLSMILGLFDNNPQATYLIGIGAGMGLATGLLILPFSSKKKETQL